MPTHLILGGARSGKSRRALDMAETRLGKRCFIATAQPLDEEMRSRIERHRRERDEAWRTIEEPFRLADAVASAPEPTVLIDCLTIWLSNLMHMGEDVARQTASLLSTISACSSEIILVSNEIGFGLVPETSLGRAFRDAQGRLNQEIAAAADRVELVVAGLPLQLKG